jgi:hypothetical protein
MIDVCMMCLLYILGLKEEGEALTKKERLLYSHNLEEGLHWCLVDGLEARSELVEVGLLRVIQTLVDHLDVLLSGGASLGLDRSHVGV